MYLTENWRLKEQRYRLEGTKLPDGTVTFPPRLVQQREVEVYSFPTQENSSAGDATVLQVIASNPPKKN